MTNAVLAAVEALQSSGAEQYVARIIDGFLQKKNGSAVLAKNMTNAKISQDVARLGLRAVQSAGRQDADLVKALSRFAGWTEEIKPLTGEQMAQMVSEVRSAGDPARGELIFHRREVSCMQCHAINGIGGNVGPDLSAVGTGSTVDYLIDSVLFPNKIIKDGFETVEVTTKDGDYILGIKVRENKQQLVLKDATHPEIVIATSTIEKRQNRKVSVMPSGLANTLTHGEFIDLIRFLSELGKPGTYANNTAPVARRWQIAAPVQPDLTPANANGLKWIPAYSQVSGLLPLNELSKIPALARCEVEVISPGKVQLQLNSVEGLKLWIDNQTQPVDAATVLDLAKGTHAFTFLIDGHRREGLRAQFDETAESPARFHIQ
jgi:putative heme-binding domain-containing protein